MADTPVLPAGAPLMALPDADSPEITLEDLAAGRLPEGFVDALAPALPDNLDHSKPAVKRESAAVAAARVRAAAIIGLRLQGKKRREIAQILGMTPIAVKFVLVRARRRGWLNDVDADLRADSAALAVEGLNALLEKRDKDAVFKTLEGLGHFKSYKHNEGGVATHELPSLNVNILNAPSTPQPVVSVGKPRED
jgi:hypothetical protein